jgi:hypothetical protein
VSQETRCRPFRIEAALFVALWPLVFVSACGGGGGGGGSAPPPTEDTVTVSGRVTFDRVPFSTSVGRGLDFDSIIEAPAREVVVEIVDASAGTVIASTSTSPSDGSYTVTVPANRNVFVRARARSARTGTAPTWELEVRDNTAGNALYVLDGSSFNTGTADVTRNLRATSGWDPSTSSYTGARAAAPFAILDTLYQATALVTAARPGVSLAALTAFWNEENRPSSSFCPENGNILTSLFLLGGDNDCIPQTNSATGIYLLGNYGLGDTDEFDQHVIAHEFGHYLENELARSDSLGGEHAIGNRLDLRVAFAEGWGNAFAAMVLDDPIYRDSLRDAQGQFDVGFDVESDGVGVRGWYNEGSVHEILWDVFDDAPDSTGVSQGETVALGFAPILDVLTNEQVATDAFASIYPFAAALRERNPVAAPGISGLLTDNAISGVGDFAVGETNYPANPNPQGTPVLEEDVLPIYTPIALNSEQLLLCGIRVFGTFNKLSNRRFLSFSLPQSRLVSITVIGLPGNDPLAPEPDPDFVIWRQGNIEYVGDGLGTAEQAEVELTGGDYLLEIYEYSHVDPTPTVVRRDRTCMTVSVTG